MYCAETPQVIEHLDIYSFLPDVDYMYIVNYHYLCKGFKTLYITNIKCCNLNGNIVSINNE